MTVIMRQVQHRFATFSKYIDHAVLIELPYELCE